MIESNRETARYYRNARKTLGFKKNKFADMLGISQAYGSLIESGDRRLPGKVMLRIEELKRLAGKC